MSYDLLSLWHSVLDQMQDQIPKASLDTWVKSLRPLRIVEDNIHFEAPNDFTRDWIKEHYDDIIKQCFFNLTKTSFDCHYFLSGEVVDTPMPTVEVSANTVDMAAKKARLNPKYTFDTFVVGDSNRFAHAAALAVAEAPARAYNPLFIYGGVGLGKTHLMHAIGHFVLSTSPQKKVMYVTSEQFTNDIINAIRDDKTGDFRDRYRNIDVLLVDDIQFLARKERTQEEFFHTFNALHEANKQIVLSSDRPPREIPTLEDRLRSRFEWGLITDIQAPDLETRIAILDKKASIEKMRIQPEALAFIAEHIHSNIRELEGALIRVVAYSSLTNRPIDISLASEALKDILISVKKTKIDIKDIQKAVSQYFEIDISEMNSRKRGRSVAFPRQVAMYLSRELTDSSLPKIGDAFGGRDHTTVLHAYEKISDTVQQDPEFAATIKELIQLLK